MIHFRYQHPVISRRLPDAVCGMDPIHTHNTDAADMTIPRDARVFSVSFAGYDRKKGRDDLIYVSVNTYWEDVKITLPDLHRRESWYLCVNTYGDGQGRYCYPEGEEIRIEKEFIMKPRSVAVFTGRAY